MNFFSKFVDKLSGNSVTDEQLYEIDNCVETIISSELAYLETNMDGLQIYRYSDYKLSVVKSILYNPFGGCEINKSVILRDNTQVYDGISAIKVDTWLSHLKSVANSVKVEKQKTYTYKKDDYNY